MKFSNSYIELGEHFYQRVQPETVCAPQLLLWNSALADDLTLTKNFQSDHRALAQFFSGNKVLTGAQPIALAYSGHQFGHFNPQLGDGRAHLLGEVFNKDNIRVDIQLKGSGKTAFSRRGDGKCALAPALREYIMSEALFALGVPTSRCLSVVSTGEIVNRGLAKSGAVVTRVANSHIRVGTFQYFASRGDVNSLRALLDYAINRHFPDINNCFNQAENAAEQRILAFFEAVIDKQITLMISWLRIGFIHGVMNTDNTAICGETIDFGPCAMLGTYHEEAVFSSIDEYGRYAFGNQGKIAQWNMARLADCLMPLLMEVSDAVEDEKESQALSKLEALVIAYHEKFEQAYFHMYANKLGFASIDEHSKALINDLLALMQKKSLDYTITFNQLTMSLTEKTLTKPLTNELGDWFRAWQEAIAKSPLNAQASQKLMQQNNPVVIPRNHHVEALLDECEQAFEAANNFTDAQASEAFNTITDLVEDFLGVLRSPYQALALTKRYQDAPEDKDKHYRTFCGT